MYYVYVLYNGEKFYIGYTTNLKRRLDEHKTGNVKSTSKMGKVQLIFYEAFVNKNSAKRREKYFKTTKGKRALRIMLSESL
jgi:putative endonuclease